jgi:Zn-dependent protease with chaperone function
MRTEPIAWFLPNAELMMSSGLVEGLRLTDAELAAILAHLISHTILGHDRDRALASV